MTQLRPHARVRRPTALRRRCCHRYAFWSAPPSGVPHAGNAASRDTPTQYGLRPGIPAGGACSDFPDLRAIEGEAETHRDEVHFPSWWWTRQMRTRSQDEFACETERRLQRPRIRTRKRWPTCDVSETSDRRRLAYLAPVLACSSHPVHRRLKDAPDAQPARLLA